MDLLRGNSRRGTYFGSTIAPAAPNYAHAQGNQRRHSPHGSSEPLDTEDTHEQQQQQQQQEEQFQQQQQQQQQQQDSFAHASRTGTITIAQNIADDHLDNQNANERTRSGEERSPPSREQRFTEPVAPGLVLRACDGNEEPHDARSVQQLVRPSPKHIRKAIAQKKGGAASMRADVNVPSSKDDADLERRVVLDSSRPSSGSEGESGRAEYSFAEDRNDGFTEPNLAPMRTVYVNRHGSISIGKARYRTICIYAQLIHFR